MDKLDQDKDLYNQYLEKGYSFFKKLLDMDVILEELVKQFQRVDIIHSFLFAIYMVNWLVIIPTKIFFQDIKIQIYNYMMQNGIINL